MTDNKAEDNIKISADFDKGIIMIDCGDRGTTEWAVCRIVNALGEVKDFEVTK